MLSRTTSPIFSRLNLQYIFSFFLIFIAYSVSSTPSDSLKKHSPKKAAIYSTCLPGLGQVYNHKLWKVPIIYTGFATVGYFFEGNRKQYVKYRDAYIARTDNNPSTLDPFPLYTTEGIKVMRDYYRRNLELTVIIGAGLYILNILDATVDAHLFKFEVSDDLSVNLRPSVFAISNQYNPGISMRLSFHYK